MNIAAADAERLKEIAGEMAELLNEFKNIVRGAMTSGEHERFRYNTLAHLEPGLHSEHTWVVGSHVRGLDLIAEDATEDAIGQDADEEDENS